MHVPSTAIRFWARAIDKVVLLIFLLPALGWAAWHPLFLKGTVVPWSLVLYAIIAALAYETLAVWLFGTTAGKWVFGLRVIPKGRPQETPSGWACLLRTLTGRLSIFFGLGIYAPLWLKTERTHPADWMAGTRVVATRPRSLPVHARPLFALTLSGLLGICGWLAAGWALEGLRWSAAGLGFD